MKDHIEWPLPPMTPKEKRAQLRSQWSIPLSAAVDGRTSLSGMMQLAGYAFAVILWLIAAALALCGFPWLFSGIFLLHAAELVTIGYRTGREARVSGAKSIALCMLFGFLWWLPLRRRLIRNKEK